MWDGSGSYPPPVPTTPPLVNARDAARALLAGQGLLDEPSRRPTRRSLRALIRRLGYVQVDTINVVERAHHHILQTRLDGYSHGLLKKLLEDDRAFFEHWTHDASIIPIEWFAHWRFRFDRYRTRGIPNTWWEQRLGPDPQKTLDHVRRRIEREGPLTARDFEHQRADADGRGGWWGWKPQKAALEFLWRIGELSITARRRFEKVYDLTHRVFPDWHDAEPPDHGEYVHWACSEALDRLTFATPSEIAHYLDAVSVHDARSWCRAQQAAGTVASVLVGPRNDDGKPRAAFATPDWEERVNRLPAAPERVRLLSPFDPVIRDRRRAAQRFGFDYRFEAFVPAAKRQHGYYVLPIMEGDRFVGRLDPKHDRERAVLVVQDLWWEPGVKPTRARRRLLRDALELFATQISADDVEFAGPGQ